VDDIIERIAKMIAERDNCLSECPEPAASVEVDEYHRKFAAELIEAVTGVAPRSELLAEAKRAVAARQHLIRGPNPC